MKLRKRFAAMCAATVMALGVLAIEANAAGTIARSYSSPNVSYDFTVNKAGARTNQGFYTTSSQSRNHTVYITPASAKLYESNTTSSYATIIIPKTAPGMPFLQR